MESSLIPLTDLVFSILLTFLPFFLGFLHTKLSQGSLIDRIFCYYLFIAVGVQGIASGVMQAFFSETVTQYVHWPFSPFIVELGLANISYGILGLLSPWMGRGWQTATCFGYASFLLFTGMRHALELLDKGVNPGNSGPFAYVDYLVSSILFVLLALKQRKESAEERQDSPGPSSFNRDLLVKVAVRSYADHKAKKESDPR